MAYIKLSGINAAATITVNAGGTSDIYILPEHSNKSIGVSWDTGTPTIYFTYSSETTIRAGAAQWMAWDLTSDINPAAMGCYIVNAGGSPIVLELAARVG